MKLPSPVCFSWDKGNIDKNWKKHSVHYKDAEEIFFNRPIKIFPDAKHSLKEKRFAGLGKTNKEQLLTIIFTIRGNKIRIISARKQNKKERKIYEKTKTTTKI